MNRAMLYAQKVTAALAAKRATFAHQEDAFGTELAAYRAALAALGHRFPSQAALVDHLTSTSSPSPAPLGRGPGGWPASVTI